MRTIPLVLLLTCAVDGLSSPAAAQQSLGVGPVMGPSFERFGNVGAGPIAFGFRQSRLTNAGPAEDFAIRIFPEALAERVILLGVDVGAMQTVALGPVGLFAKGGVSTIAGLGGGATFIPGLQAGFGTLVRLQRRAALRVDVTRHWYYPDGERYTIWSFGVGISALPPAAGNRPR